MLIGSIALGLVLGLLFGGRIGRLADIRLRLVPLLVAGVAVRFGTEAALGAGAAAVDQLRVPLLALGYGLLLAFLWRNRAYPGLLLAFVGIASNGLVILVNGGRMPVWMPAYEASGLAGPLTSVLHLSLPVDTAGEFLAHLGPLADIVPIPITPFNNVTSVGDLFLSAGLGFFLFASVMHRPTVRHGRIETGSGLTASLEGAAALERPLLLGSGGVAMAQPALASFPVVEGADGAGLAVAGSAASGAIAVPAPRERPSVLGRVRRHPYVRLALNGSFSALWVGQLISLFGDRVNQLALVAFVYEATRSPFAVALAFLVGTLPNLILSPIAGTYVDRWNHKHVLVASDLLRAALVLLIPIALLGSVWLAYPLVFAVTTASLFFRPARVAVLPRIVAADDLLAANSAMWVGETIADVVNYPIAGLFVVFLAGSLPVAFWFDAATYLASALLLGSMVVPPVVRRMTRAAEAPAATGADAAAAAAEHASVAADLKEGWAFLRHETVLLANTVQGAAGQFAGGIVTVASLIVAQHVTTDGGSAYRGTYAFMETSIGVGNLVGGFVLGLVASRAPKGLMVIAAYVAFGVLVIVLGIAPSIPIVLGALFGIGVANMAFVIPSQTLFQERTPPELMGRVVSFRSALVLGGMSIAMGVGGLLIGVVDTGPVLAGAGVLSIVAGLAGLLVRAVREA